MPRSIIKEEQISDDSKLIKKEQISDDSKLIWNAFWSTKNNKWYYQKMENNKK